VNDKPETLKDFDNIKSDILTMLSISNVPQSLPDLMKKLDVTEDDIYFHMTSLIKKGAVFAFESPKSSTDLEPQQPMFELSDLGREIIKNSSQ